MEVRTIRTALIGVAALLGAGAANAELDLNRADISHLQNGLTVILLEDHSFPVVSVQMFYKSGSAAEVTGKTGLAHFLEHLVFRDSKNFPDARSTELIYDAGGEWHAYTSIDQTTYFETMPKDGLDLLLRIEADRMAGVVISPASIEAEKGSVITELHALENDPASVLSDAVTATAIQAHPYGKPAGGYISDVKALTAEDARAFYASHYAPGNAVLAVVGDFVPAQAKALVTKEFGPLAARPVAEWTPTTEPPQKGERRTQLVGPVDRQYFNFTFHSPAASNPDFPAFLVLQQLLSGGSGVNVQQDRWAPAPASPGALLSGLTDDIATWLPPTRDPFIFTISGSIPAKANRSSLEQNVDRRIATLRDASISDARLAGAKSAVERALVEDVETTQNAAHQLAFFEGIGALQTLFELPQRVAAVTTANIQHVALAYFMPEQRTIGWLVPGVPPSTSSGIGQPRSASDHFGKPPLTGSAGQPQLQHLSGGLPAIVQPNPLSDTATVELLLSAPARGGAHPLDLPHLDAVIRSGTPDDLVKLVSGAVEASRSPVPSEPQSQDPASRLQQLISTKMKTSPARRSQPLGVVVSGKVDPQSTFDLLERQLGHTISGALGRSFPAEQAGTLTVVRERIAKPLSQGAMGYVVEGPAPASREGLAWRMLLYILTHDYSGRLGLSAIERKGLVYHIYSSYRTDGSRSWATIWTGVDPDKADALEAELRSQLAGLSSNPPTYAELEAARQNLLGRDISAAQSNEELAAKLTRQFVETGGLRSHGELEAALREVTVADLANAARAFASGTILRVDVLLPASASAVR